MMSRRNASPVRVRGPPVDASAITGLDQRDLIIKKLKEELIKAHSKKRQVDILANFLAELNQKTRMAYDEIRKKQNEAKSKVDVSQKMMNDFKREVDICKGELKVKSIELGEQQTHLLEIKRHLTKRNSQLQKIKNETLSLKEENQRLLQENDSFVNRFNEIKSELLKLESVNKNLETRGSQINNKIGEVRGFIGEQNKNARNLKDQLRKHEQENTSISDQLNTKQENIDRLEKVFVEEHDQIKNQIDLFIQLEHRNERVLTQIRHKINLNKAQNEKANELNATLQKFEKVINNMSRESQIVQDGIDKFTQSNNDYYKFQEQLGNDLEKCQIHFQNLMKYNAQIQEELERYLREDQHIIGLIKKKRMA